MIYLSHLGINALPVQKSCIQNHQYFVVGKSKLCLNALSPPQVYLHFYQPMNCGRGEGGGRRCFDSVSNKSTTEVLKAAALVELFGDANVFSTPTTCSSFQELFGALTLSHSCSLQVNCPTRKYSTAMCRLLAVGAQNFSGAHTLSAYWLLSANRPNNVSDVCNVCMTHFWNEMELLKCCILGKLLLRVLNQQ